MSDPPSPEVRALTAKLFAAGRAERPGPALGRRLLLIEPAEADDLARSRHQGALRLPAVVPVPSRVALWLAAAALIAGGVGLSLVLEHDPGAVRISAERDPGRGRSNSAEHPAPVPAPLPGLEARGASAADVARRGDDAERATPRSGTAARPRAGEHRSSVDSVLPRSVAPSAPESADSPTPPVPMTLLAELDLLKRAHTALRAGDGEQALALLGQRAREHTANGLEAEATLLRIEALAATGKQAEASELATRFVRENPNSALSDRAKSFLRSAAPSP